MRIAVIGAGIVGVSAAEWLRRDGHEVTLWDRVEPGDPRQTSYGNAGVLAAAAVLPVPAPGLVRHAPRMLLDPDGPLFLRWRHLPRLLPWLVPYLGLGTEAGVRRIAAALAPLIGDSVEQHEALARGTAAERFVTRGEYVYLYPDRAAAEAERAAWELRAEHGYRFAPRDRAALLARDPHLGPGWQHGMAQLDHGWISDPGRYVAALAGHFRRHGGTFRLAEVDDVAPGEAGVEVVAGGDRQRYDRAVLAAGAWSARLAGRLGHRARLESERGYHLMLGGTSLRPPSAYMLTTHRFAVTPMDAGIRCAGLIEYGGLDAPAAPGPVALLRRCVRRLYPALEWETEASWLGHRPTTADCLPMIGPSPTARHCYFAFGAQHVGLTSGPKTGRLIAGLIAGRPPNIDLAPFRVGRFDR